MIKMKHYIHVLGFSLLLGFTVPTYAESKASSENVQQLTQKADQGDIDAIHKLIAMYGKGETVAKDEQKALQYSRKGAALGDVQSKYMTGMILLHSSNASKQDIAEATKLLTEVAESGHAHTQATLGSYYLTGELLPKNIERGVKWTEAAAKQNHGLALNNLGWMYYKGTGVKQDNKKAVEYLEKAVKQNNALAYGNLATLYSRGDGVKQNDKKAVELLQKAVELGEPLAKVNLALAYYNGTGIKQDQGKAYQLIQEAAEAGVPQAIELLQGAQTDANGCREVQSMVDGKVYTAIECPIS
ncbi:tetratricopeptide repeat protein [Acinetobacter sp. CFCC 10889]|uniref:tetratricopeptide repeat protein n=1 Tax=Acinetobacter sp. CFCC 10889 TaxID=1775557 RepID=UPI000DD0DDAB|nr:tetratricopeptide repeat protein [Acinetobacter sp. CFCC 10889]